jgi:hypothetical protein
MTPKPRSSNGSRRNQAGQQRLRLVSQPQDEPAEFDENLPMTAGLALPTTEPVTHTWPPSSTRTTSAGDLS